jgi:hypothetical protein
MYVIVQAKGAHEESVFGMEVYFNLFKFCKSCVTNVILIFFDF